MAWFLPRGSRAKYALGSHQSLVPKNNRRKKRGQGTNGKMHPTLNLQESLQFWGCLRANRGRQRRFRRAGKLTRDATVHGAGDVSQVVEELQYSRKGSKNQDTVSGS